MSNKYEKNILNIFNVILNEDTSSDVLKTFAKNLEKNGYEINRITQWSKNDFGIKLVGKKISNVIVNKPPLNKDIISALIDTGFIKADTINVGAGKKTNYMLETGKERIYTSIIDKRDGKFKVINFYKASPEPRGKSYIHYD